jgi:MinD-like ATPase involved in chromosome partitioning or flagellar assembly
MSEGNVVTFYSYKGGVGRTLVLASVGALLSVWGYKVLCIDWDLEAPGLHLYYKKWAAQSDTPGLTELIQSHVDNKSPHWQDYITQINFPHAKEPLSLMTAGKQDESYIRRVQDLDWKVLYEEQDLGIFLEELRQTWKQEFDFILLDSRTGITDIGGICTIQLPDILALLFTANEQSLYGAVNVANRAIQLRDSLPFDRSKLLVLPVPTRFESRIEYELAQEWLTIFADVLAPFYSQWAGKDTTAADLLNFIKIPYIPYWSFGEKVPVLEEGTKDPESIGFAIETLAAMIALKLASSDLLVSKRDSFVGEAELRPLQEPLTSSTRSSINQKRKAHLLLIYSHRDELFRDELAQHLAILKRQDMITTWHEQSISAGAEWASQVNLQAEEADIILILVSASFLASDYAYGREIQRALERHEAGEARIIPIIVRPVEWKSYLPEQLHQLQILPKDGKPITSWDDRDEAYLNIIKGIREAVEQVSTKGVFQS